MVLKSRLSLYCLQGLLIILLGLKGSLVWSVSAMEAETGWAGLDLTPEQGRSLKDLKAKFRQEESQIQKKMMIKRMELMTLSAEEFRGEKGEDLRRHIQALLLQARERALFYQQEALSILTADQKKSLPPDFDLGFRCRGWFGRGGGPGMGMGMGSGRGNLARPPRENRPVQP